MVDAIEKKCDEYCFDIMAAAIDARFNAPRAHNFTGNLITSIVVCLYKKKKPIAAYYAAEQLSSPIAVKMTFPKRYHFKQDYDGAESHFLPLIKTNEDYGENDARQFFQSYRPQGNNLFDIVVAYPVEYADFVEQVNQSTGILRAYERAEWMGIEIFELAIA